MAQYLYGLRHPFAWVQCHPACQNRRSELEVGAPVIRCVVADPVVGHFRVRRSFVRRAVRTNTGQVRFCSARSYQWADVDSDSDVQKLSIFTLVSLIGWFILPGFRQTSCRVEESGRPCEVVSPFIDSGLRSVFVTPGAHNKINPRKQTQIRMSLGLFFYLLGLQIIS